MIKILIKNKDRSIQQISVIGHADAGEYGNDLVCAAITGIVSGALNAYDVLHHQDVNLSVLKDQVTITNLNEKNHELQVMLKMLKIQLETIWIQYQKNIDMKEEY